VRADGLILRQLGLVEEGSLPRLHIKRNVFVADYRFAVPLHELRPVREKGPSKKASRRDNSILPECPMGLRERIAVGRTL